jgi:hypothetical protein
MSQHPCRNAALGLMLGLLSACGNWSDSAVKESVKRGDRIVAAIESHIAATGQPPSTLEALVPKYIQELPLPTAGTRRWEYWIVDNGRGYEVAFAANDDSGLPCWFYTSSDKTWHLDDT